MNNTDLKKLKNFTNLLMDFIRKNPFPKRIPEANSCDKIAIVTVNYNTKEYISVLLFSIFKNLGTSNIAEIVVVDNNSVDGSLQLLKKLDEKGLIKLISNNKQKYHGPGLNQAINYLSKRVKEKHISLRYIWILDSDTIVLRKDTVDKACLFMQETSSSVIGEFQKNGYPHISSIWIDPFRVWKKQVSPFTSCGFPSLKFYRDVLNRKGTINQFPFMKNNYVLHLGEGTLKQIYNKKEIGNEFFDWASKYHMHHYHDNQMGNKIHEEILDLYARKTEVSTGGLVELLCSSTNCQKEFERILSGV